MYDNFLRIFFFESCETDVRSFYAVEVSITGSLRSFCSIFQQNFSVIAAITDRFCHRALKKSKESKIIILHFLKCIKKIERECKK